MAFGLLRLQWLPLLIWTKTLKDSSSPENEASHK